MKVRLSRYLHKPALVVALEVQELGVFGLGYGIGIIGGGWWWLAFIVMPFPIIIWMRKQTRGYLTHLGSYVGITEIKGYPKMITKEFRE